MGKGEIFDRQAVDEAVVGWGGEALDRAPHGQMGGPENIERVDFSDAGDGDRPDDLRVAGDEVVKVFPAAAGEFFGVVQSGAGKPRRQDYRRCGNRAGEGAPPGLVDAGDGGFPLIMQLLFKGKVRHGPDSIRSVTKLQLPVRADGTEKLGGEDHPVRIDDHADAGVGPVSAHGGLVTA